MMVLTATDQSVSPQPHHPKAEYTEATEIARYRVVVEVTLYNRFEPLSGLSDWVVHAPSELLLNFLQLPPQALTDRMALYRKAPVPVLPADVREPQKIECLRLTLSSLFPVLFGETPQLNPARLVWV